MGLEKPDEGDVYADGERITDVYPGDRDIAIMFQNLALYPDKTVFGNLAFPLRQAKAPKDEIRRRVGRTAETLHIEHLLDRKPGKLSGGERQRVAIARAIVNEPKLLLADEPTGNLDSASAANVADLLFQLREKAGTTLVLVTHDDALAARCTRRVRIRDGVIVDDTNRATAARSIEPLAAS